MPISASIEIYLEVGSTKTFACAVDWPGWCRSGKDEASAIKALLNYAPRYHAIVKSAGLPFGVPQSASDFSIIDRIKGDYATNFGVPDLPISKDTAPLSDETVLRYTAILEAAWSAFDRIARSAQGKELRKGPRGGGRELDEIIAHVGLAERGYLRHLGCDGPDVAGLDIVHSINLIRSRVLECIPAAAGGQIPPPGPRRAKRWPLAYFFRRIAWHVVDHAWEIEDRVI